MLSAEVTAVGRDGAGDGHERHYECAQIINQVFAVAFDEKRDIRHQLNDVGQVVHQLLGGLWHPRLVAELLE